MDDNVNQAFQQAATFQKMWTDSFSDMAQVWTRYSPAKPPPDAMREMRAGMLKILTQSWEDFVRSPQFLEYMKKGMDGVLDFKKLSSDFFTRGHHSTETPAREDIDGILLAIRHMERRLLDRVEEVDSNVSGLGRRLDKVEKNSRPAPTPVPREGVTKPPARKAPARKAPARKASARKAPARKAPARKASTRKAPVRKTVARKTTPKS
ncbi:MAG: hypothetical protein DRP71_08620 [Verrucomicrobia bacterium]|nr:MAG: hypothetical protein DRP71_08620 [Verrucomicrobiota bacterium]